MTVWESIDVQLQRVKFHCENTITNDTIYVTHETGILQIQINCIEGLSHGELEHCSVGKVLELHDEE